LTVVDTTPPTITAPPDVTVSTNPGTSTASNVALGMATASDDVAIANVTNDAPAAFPLGMTTVTWTAVDTSGNSVTANQHVTVVDTEPPTIEAHADVVAEATGSDGAAVRYTAPATHDNVDNDSTATCSPTSGSTFSLGTAIVTCNATDAAGNHALPGTFAVTVVDTTAPVVTVPGNITAEATGPAGAALTFTASATDAVDGARAGACTPASGSTFGIATTTVTCTAIDTHGNTGSASFTVTVRDTTPPVVTVPGNITVNATSPSGATVTFAASATDIVAGTVATTCSPASGSTFAIGPTTVTCAAQDFAANAATRSFQIIVRGAADQITDVKAVVQSYGLSIKSQTRLLIDLEVALQAVNRNEIAVACGALDKFITDVNGLLRRRELTMDRASRLINDANRIKAVLGCL
jgi:hypothetical protein